MTTTETIHTESLTRVEGLTPAQAVIIGAVAAAVVLLLDRAWDWLTDWWIEQRGQLADKPIADASDDHDEELNQSRFVASAMGRWPWWPVTSNGTVHTASCRHAESLRDWLSMPTAAEGAACAAELGWRPGRCCQPFADVDDMAGTSPGQMAVTQ